ncbi:50S ribosomal protein L7 [Oscillibacter valericigenes]|uniref:L7Ae/L30e/S12e/Gadd45 family ribosomal protein n=1 Tax=Oscillibacter valericigenes TaxID=351091 RepID=UPI001F1A79CC|nr:50S ribosomal protein L7 [Oscillibacter valericigenes]MCF2664520.1 50S ribosomal protein L7 [Oscillibacter valericigenes]
MDSNRILSLLGLALRGGNLAVGEEPVEAVARARDARVLLLASDAADNTRRRVEHFAEAGQCLWLRVPFTKAELGRAVGRSSAAVTAVTDIGLANTIVHRLAELDPVKYDEAAAKLELKAKRAAERRAEQLAHEKNLRTGKRKPKKEVPEQAVPEKAAPKQAAPAKPAARKDTRTAPAAGKPRTGRPGPGKSRPSKGNRPKSRSAYNPYAHSRPVKKGKGSFRKQET